MKKGLLAIGGMFILLIVSIVLLIKGCNPKIKIIDNTGDVCDEGQYYFYEDEKYDYYFECQKIYLVEIDGIRYDLEAALKNERITINDLENEDVKFNKTAK